MKKLLSFLVAGIAALGLASCSGDLHNEFDPTSELAKALFDTSIKIEDFETFELCGSMTADDPNTWINDASHNVKFVENEEDGTWEADFLSTDQDEQGFCFITKTGKWDDYQIGGESMEAGTLPDGVKFSSKKGGGKHEDAILSGLKKKTFYKMIVDASSGKYVISIEKSTATPFYLNGYFLRTGENGADATGATVLGTPILDRKTYNVTYSYEFTFNSAYTPDISVTDSTTQVAFKLTQGATELGYYDGTFTVGTTKKPVALTLEQDSKKVSTHSVNLIKGLIDGKTYVLTIETTPEKDVTLTVAEKPFIKVVGVKLVNLDSTVYPAGTGFALGGDQIGWPGDWGSPMASVDSNGTLEYTAPVAGILYKGDTASILIRPNAGWADRIAKSYRADNGNGKIELPSDVVYGAEYIIYADLEGVTAGSDVPWTLIKNN